eukprot:11164891-Karenia_brevis.AAC.1
MLNVDDVENSVSLNSISKAFAASPTVAAVRKAFRRMTFFPTELSSVESEVGYVEMYGSRYHV